MSALPPILMDEGAFIQAMESAGCQIKGHTCTCPFHDDKSPSAQWSQGNDGTWRMYCHVCRKHANVLDIQAHTTGKSVQALFKEAADTSATLPAPTPRKCQESTAGASSGEVFLSDKRAVVAYASRSGVVESWHPYGDKSNPCLVVARIRLPNGKKKFNQFTPKNGGWVNKNLLERGTFPLYRQAELGDRVLVVEGEKCVDAAFSVGVPATTSAMGAGNASHSDWSYLIGRTVFLWPDNDETGAKHMAEVKQILSILGVKAHLIDINGIGLKQKGDVYDLIQALDGKSVDEIKETINGIMDDALPQSASAELSGLIDDITSGKFVNIAWPGLELIGTLSKALLPGCITTICADPGAGKSLLMLQMIAGWHRQGVAVSLLALEDERRMHLQRVLAQSARNSRLTDDEWVRDNAAQAHGLIAGLRDELDQIGERIKAEGEEQMSLQDIGDWVEGRAKNKDRVIVIDPVTAAKTEREPWAADMAFMMRCKKIVRQHGCSIVFVTHPRGSAKGASMHAMAGGTAYPRFSHCALWLEKFHTEERETVDGSVAMCNRAINITKSRHGRGGGVTIGCLFDSDTLTFVNQCTLAPESKRKPVQFKSLKIADSKAHQTYTKQRAAKVAAPPSDDENLFA